MHCLQGGDEASETNDGTSGSNEPGCGTGVLFRSSGTGGSARGSSGGISARRLLITRGLRGGRTGLLSSGLGGAAAGAGRDGVATDKVAQLAGIGGDQAGVGAVGRQSVDPAGDLLSVLISVLAGLAEVRVPVLADAAGEFWLVAEVGVGDDDRGDVGRDGRSSRQVGGRQAAHDIGRKERSDVADDGAEVDGPGGEQRGEIIEIDTGGEQVTQVQVGGVLAPHELADLDDLDLRTRSGERRGGKKRDGEKGRGHFDSSTNECRRY